MSLKLNGNGTISGFSDIEVADGTANAPTISNIEDTNTGIFFPSDNTIAISTNGTEKIRVDSNGNVGIGRNSPSSPLDVYLTSATGIVAQFRTSYEGGRVQFFWPSQAEPSLLFGDGTGYKFNIGKYSDSGVTKFFTVLDNGNIGIGTTNPSTKMDLKSISDNCIITLQSDSKSWHIRNQQDGTFGFLNSTDNQWIMQSDTNGIRFYTGGTERIRTDTAGRVTTPYQTSCEIQQSGTISIASGDTYTQVPLNLVNWSVGNNFNTSTYRFIAPIAGVYLVSVRAVIYDNSNSRFGIAIRVNGANATQDPLELSVGSFAYPRIAYTRLMKLETNDYLTLHVNQYSGTTINLFGGFMQVYLLG